MEHNTIPERMREIEIFGVPALFTDKPASSEAVYPGLYRYALQAGENGNPLGTVLTPVLPVDDSREVRPGDMIVDTGAGYYTPSEFEEKYLSPYYGGKERYGKPRRLQHP